MIPETAIQAAAAKLLNHTPPHWCPQCQGKDPFCPRCDRDSYELMEAALEAALPHLEVAIRKQIAADIRAEKEGHRPGTLRRIVLEQAASIAEEGTTK